MIESPCVKVCTLDESGEVCMGCFRTVGEIAQWSQMGDPARARVLEAATARRRSAGDRAPLAVRGAASFCEACGGEFTCGASDPAKPCWCVGYPPVTPRGPRASCLCPACLAAASRQEG
jgi:predicted Fe-S protein YdhL (DUF1289 family)